MVGVVDVLHAAPALRHVLAICEDGLVGQTAFMADIGEEDERRHVDCEVLAVQQQQQLVSRERGKEELLKHILSALQSDLLQNLLRQPLDLLGYDFAFCHSIPQHHQIGDAALVSELLAARRTIREKSIQARLVEHVIQSNQRQLSVDLVVPALEHRRQELVHPKNGRLVHGVTILNILTQSASIRTADDDDLQHLGVRERNKKVLSKQ